MAAPIKKAIIERGFSGPTEPQSKAMPLILKGKNVLLIAPTGTGKTEAAFLPILHFILQSNEEKGIKALYITPLRALNRDMLDRMTWWCKKLDIRLAVRHGDTGSKERATQAAAPPDILITTPETLQAILPARIMKGHLQKVKWVVVDEVHELAGDKRGSQLSLGLERLRRLAGDFQIIGLSATIGTPEKVAKFLVGVGRNCEIVNVPVARFMDIKVLFPSPKKEDYQLAIKLYTYPEVAARLRVMRELIDSHESTLLFTNTRSTTEVLASRFRVWDLEFPLGIHHGSLSKPSRVTAERDLKTGKLKGIVCTSSLELGIDIGRLDLVIQYNSPRQVTRLVQRVGRSGHRLGEIAKGIIIAQDSDDFLESVVIGRRSKKEQLEPVVVPEKPFDALCHQIAGLLIEKGRWSFDEVLEIFRKAYPYRDLKEEDLVQVLEYMSDRIPRLAFYSREERIFIRPRNIRELYDYYFENLSMIPEEKHFLVIEEETDSPIGLLDEAFVSEHGEIGTKFIERGSVWKILHVYQDKIYVKAEEDPAGAIPSWVGEEIPVPFEVAQEVGAIRGMVERKLKQGVPIEQVLDEFRDLPAEKKAITMGFREIVEQVERGLPVPTDKRITMESWKGFVIIHCSFGLLVNKTLARVMGYILSEEIGTPIGVQQDPYRIILKTGYPVEEVKKKLLELSRADIQTLAEKAMVKTGIFKRKLVHVARKFGALEKSADVSTAKMDTLLQAFKDTPIYTEALKSALRDDSDIPNTSVVLKRMASGEIEVVVLPQGDISPIGRIGMEEIGRRYDIVPPEKMRRIIVEATKARLLSESGTLLCTDCWKYLGTHKVKDLSEKISCSRCQSDKVAFLDEDEEKVIKLGEKIRLGIELQEPQRRMKAKAERAARLIASYGKMAAMVLAGRGITSAEAEKVLRKEKAMDSIIELVIEEEKSSLRRGFFRKR